MQRVGNFQAMHSQKIIPRFQQALMRLCIDRLEEADELAMDFFSSNDALHTSESLEQSRKFTPVAFGKLSSNVSLLVDQASLDNGIWELFCHRVSQCVCSIQHGQDPMMALEPAADDTPHQFSRNFQVFTASEGEVEHVLLAYAVDADGGDGNLLFAQANAIEHYNAPDLLPEIPGAKFIDQL